MHKHAAVHAETEYAKALIGKIHVMCLHTMALHMYTYILLHCINSICGKTVMSVSVHHSLPVNTCTDGPLRSTSTSLNQVITTCSYHYRIIYHACRDRSVVAN